MKNNNPFTLTFGKKPNEYISRYENTETIISTFEADNPVSQAYLIQGIRGSGKTVLMTAVTSELSKKDNYIVVDLNSTNNLLDDLAMRLNDVCKKKPDLIDMGFNISIAGFGVGINGSSSIHDNISIIEEILSELKKKGKKVVITIDEVMHDENMRHFASEFQLFLRKDYSVYLIMTGLYENIYAIQNDPALTFLLRTPKIELEPLSLHQISKQYRDIFRIELSEAKELARITKGYAFAFQAFGMLYFEYRETLDMDSILSKLDDMLDDFVYKKIWDSMSEQDRNVVRCISYDSKKVKDICEALSMSSSTFSKYRDRLLKRGILCSPQHGIVTLALPRFANVIETYD